MNREFLSLLPGKTSFDHGHLRFSESASFVDCLYECLLTFNWLSVSLRLTLKFQHKVRQPPTKKHSKVFRYEGILHWKD